ncbi:MAG: hypothetical protein J7K12_05040 [Thermoplasmata archaeon]|nr:hypothetical protein [Thermoplasmata archaeon]
MAIKMKGIVVIAIAILLLPSIVGMNIQKKETQLQLNENHDYKVVIAIEKHGKIVKAYARMVNATTSKFIFHWGDGSITTIYANKNAVAEHSYERNGMYKIRVEAVGKEKYRSNVEYAYIGKDDCVFVGSNDCENENGHAIAIANVVTRGMKATFEAYGNWLHRWDFDNNGIYDTPWINEKEIRHVYEKPYNGYAKLQVKNGNETDESLIRVIAMPEQEDQKQDKIEDFVKVYRGHEYAQTFIPTMLNLTKIKIYVARKGIAYDDIPFYQILSLLFPNLFSNLLGDLYIEIYEGTPMNGRHLKEIVVEPSKISKYGAWLSIDIGIILSSWNKHYSIVLWQSGGNERNYYKWYYATGNPYPNGSFYYLERGWKEDSSKDFAFITYGEPTGDEPDGVEERWAVIIGGPNLGEHGEVGSIDVRITRDVLVQRGWDPSHIWTIYPDESNLKNVENAIEQMKKAEDMDDICLVSWSAHGSFNNGVYTIYLNGALTGKKLKSWLDDFACKGMLLLAETCHAGGAIYDLAQPKRVILAACAADRLDRGVKLNWKYYGSWLHYFLADQTGACHNRLHFPPKDPVFGAKDGAFARSDPDTSSEYKGNNDGWISAEEGFEFYCKWIDEFTKKYPPEMKPDPQIYDGYDGDLNVVKWRE